MLRRPGPPAAADSRERSRVQAFQPPPSPISCGLSIAGRAPAASQHSWASALAAGAGRRPASHSDTEKPYTSRSRASRRAPCSPAALQRWSANRWWRGRSSRGGSMHGTTCAARWPSRVAGRGRTIWRRLGRRLQRRTVSAAAPAGMGWWCTCVCDCRQGPGSLLLPPPPLAHPLPLPRASPRACPSLAVP